MLLKLLKYDMKSIWKIAFVVSLISLAASAAGGVGLRFFMDETKNPDSSPFILIAFFAVLVAIFAMVATNVVISIFVYVRFYKNLYTDEGYLTFTLPVSRRQILLSKTLNSLFWSLYQAIILIISLFIFTLFLPRSDNSGAVGDLITDSFVSLVELSSGWDVLSAIFLILTVIAYAIFGVCLVHFCISLTAMLVKRGRLIVGIILYIAISGAAEALIQVLFIGEALIFDLLFGYGTQALDSPAAHAFAAGMLFIDLIISVGVLFLTYFLTQKIIDRKLNLA